jgi:hypothetical protein
LERDKLARQLLSYLEKMESPVLESLQAERQEAEQMFDSALKMMA